MDALYAAKKCSEQYRSISYSWNWPRHIVHYTADDLWQWHFESVLNLSSERVIDACVHPIGNEQYKMWYKDENHDSYTYSAISNDLYHWEVCGKEIDYNSHEGPNVFELGGKKYQKAISLIYSTLRIRILPMNIDWTSHILRMQKTAEHAYRQRSWK